MWLDTGIEISTDLGDSLWETAMQAEEMSVSMVPDIVKNVVGYWYRNQH